RPISNLSINTSIQEPSYPRQSLCGRRILFVLLQSPSVFLFRSNPIALRFIHTAEIHVRVAVTFISRGLQGSFEPRNCVVVFTFHDQVRTDVVVWITESWIDFDGLLAFRDRVIDTSHPTVCPTKKRMCLRSRISCDRFLVKLDRLIQLFLHLMFVSFLKKLDG